MYGVVDEAGHKAAGGLPVVRVAQALIKAPIEDVALCWWQAGRRKVGTESLQLPSPFASKLGSCCLHRWMTCQRRRRFEASKLSCCRRYWSQQASPADTERPPQRCIDGFVACADPSSGVGLREHAGLPAGKILGARQKAGVPARKAQEGGHHFFQGFLLRISHVSLPLVLHLRLCAAAALHGLLNLFFDALRLSGYRVVGIDESVDWMGMPVSAWWCAQFARLCVGRGVRRCYTGHTAACNTFSCDLQQCCAVLIDPSDHFTSVATHDLNNRHRYPSHLRRKFEYPRIFINHRGTD